MNIKVKLSEVDWAVINQSLYHRALQTENPTLKARIADLLLRIDAQVAIEKDKIR